MDVAEVYAINIQPRQIIEATLCKPDDVELERCKFLEWLRRTGRKFLSQLDAWSVYIFQETDFVAALEIDDLNDLSEDEFVMEFVLYRARKYGSRIA